MMTRRELFAALCGAVVAKPVEPAQEDILAAGLREYDRQQWRLPLFYFAEASTCRMSIKGRGLPGDGVERVQVQYRYRAKNL